MNRLDTAFWDDVRALPILAAIDHDEQPAADEVAERFGCIAGILVEAKPEHVDRRPEIAYLQPGCLANGRTAPVRTDPPEPVA